MKKLLITTILFIFSVVSVDGGEIVKIGEIDGVSGERTLVVLSSISASPRTGMVAIRWTTASEVDNTGFNIYRSEELDGEYTKINEDMIPSEGSPTKSTFYSFVDDDITNGTTYYYTLEDIDIDDNSTMHGPVSATPEGNEDDIETLECVFDALITMIEGIEECNDKASCILRSVFNMIIDISTCSD